VDTQTPSIPRGSSRLNAPLLYDEAVNADVLDAIASPRVAVEWLAPMVDQGRWMAKAAVGQPLFIEANIFSDGHEQLVAQVLWHAAETQQWVTLPLQYRGNDLWDATLYPTASGKHRLIVEAWIDEWGTYRNELIKKRDAGLDIALEIREGIQYLQQLVAANSGQARHLKFTRALQGLCERITASSTGEACAQLLDASTATLAATLSPRDFLTRTAQTIEVDREIAAFASWYELFPRSEIAHPASTHGTFDDVIARLPTIHAMGFDVLYFPPIHPIGRTNRKGRNNALRAAPGEPGSPYAIGSSDGGHDAVHPELGGIEAFQRLRSAAQSYGIELALDFAIQCSPDHPWLTEHPEWFRWRPDGSMRYAENPPKRYEDIVSVDFYAEGAKPDLWLALLDVVLFWVKQGVTIFRVDNPHTKPLPFWQWLIATVRNENSDVIFLSEAFTRPAMMYRLAKIGFSQSYTYFTWRNSPKEIREYLTELTTAAPRDFYRPNFFVNTPDINPYFLQTSGRPGFIIRAALAATLSGLWGMYSGFELCESEPVPGKEEYWHSEKYEVKRRDWQAPGNIVDVISRLNQIRRENPALHTHLGVKFHDSGNDQVLYFSKFSPKGGNRLLVAISLDPHRAQEAYLPLPVDALALAAGAEYDVDELMRGQRYRWRDEAHHWYFNPDELPLAIWRINVGDKGAHHG
jgi:starch synthase (maltosyl-transferring)